MRLYYYTAKQWGMKSLWEKRLKIASYADLNDPFELLPFIQQDQDFRKQMNMVVKVLSDGWGVLCFSETWQSTLMWAHYGDKHKGICLGFEVEDGPHLTKIEYVASRLKCPIDFSKQLGKADTDMLAKCLHVKHSGWEYEKERRLRVPLNEPRDELFYNPFNDGMQLREVIIGARSSLKAADVAEAIGTEPPADVKIWTVRPAHGAFNMCRHRGQPSVTISGLASEVKAQRQLARALREWEERPEAVE